MTTLGWKCGVSLTDEIKYERLRGPTKRTKMCKKIEENKMPDLEGGRGEEKREEVEQDVGEKGVSGEEAFLIITFY